MPSYLISVVNNEFAVENEEAHPDVEAAIAQAVKGALELGVEQVLTGKPFFGAEVTVSADNDRRRFVIAVGASALK